MERLELLDDPALQQLLEEEGKHQQRIGEEQQRHQKSVAGIYAAAARRTAWERKFIVVDEDSTERWAADWERSA